MTDIDTLIANTIREDVRAGHIYNVPDASGYVKLDAMENPYELPENLRQQLAQRLADAVLNRYPVPSYATLKQKIRDNLGVPAGYDVILGNGSDEIISIIAMATARQDKRAVVLAPVPAFVMFQRSAQFAGMDFVGVPLKADFTLDRAAMLAAIEQHKPSVVFLAYPNNPTGNLYDEDDMVAIIEALGEHGIAVVDEAYQPFARVSFMERLPQYPNLMVMRTLSKLGLAGIRLGYLAAAPSLLQQFDKVRPPYNINVLTQVAAEFALDHLDVLNEQAARLNEARSELAAALAALPGVTVFPSSANFITVRVPDAERTCAKLFDARVMIKNLSKMHVLLANCIRVTVSTPEENSVFLNALKASL
ncbi:histidinol-phosphate aminotransferase [Massilia sp. WF1]|uniref:histidinol-phosphate transaminase n=1 Tax=unclassified Massilia TaxID=2609279 RepID=UPI0006494E9B|nr:MULTISPECIES: histidinol-phosphate transaminase [unclassified Massilia]ALK94983.1 histidinol-phosphate aminotransferase [Massilia sp. WG5]KLU38401.1 histidinol-phosphate aminotransferase [Massilia sp. WF1]